MGLFPPCWFWFSVSSFILNLKLNFLPYLKIQNTIIRHQLFYLVKKSGNSLRVKFYSIFFIFFFIFFYLYKDLWLNLKKKKTTTPPITSIASIWNVLLCSLVWYFESVNCTTCNRVLNTSLIKHVSFMIKCLWSPMIIGYLYWEVLNETVSFTSMCAYLSLWLMKR